MLFRNTLSDGKEVEGQWALLRRCFKTNEFPTRTSSAGFSHQHPTLRAVNKLILHRILPELRRTSVRTAKVVKGCTWSGKRKAGR